MSSSRIDSDGKPVALPARPAAAARLDNHQRWYKRILPRSLYGRSLLIIILPLVLAQLIATWFFYDRHWETVSRRLSASVAADIAFTLDALGYADNQEQRDQLFARAAATPEL